MGEAPLAGRVALVTGVSRRAGIGFAVARRLLDAGASVLVHAWAPHDAAQPWGADAAGTAGVVAALGAEDRTRLVEADLADPAAPRALVDAAHDAFGRLDVLVANHARSATGGIDVVTAAELDACWAVNARATLLLVQALAARHPAGRPARVVLLTSGQHHVGMPDEVAYAVSKGAVQQATATLAAGLAGHGITVNCVDPGPTDTGWAGDALRDGLAARMLGGRLGAPDDAARLIAWLCTDDAGWVTGQTIRSDGGGLT